MDVGIDVTITGLTGFLMHRYNDPGDPGRRRKRKYDPEEEAEKGAYRNEKGELYIPAEGVRKSMITAAKQFKIGRMSAARSVAASIDIKPEQFVLDAKDYEIDKRPVVIQKARIMRYRPLIREWEVSFLLTYDDEDIPNQDMLKQILEYAGRKVGIGDYRPQNMGKFGRFSVTRWRKARKGKKAK